MDKAKILRLLDEADDIVSALYRQGAYKDYKCKSLREKQKAIVADITAPPKSSADCIRQMTDEELAEWLDLHGECNQCAYHPAQCKTECNEGHLKWLKQEVSEDAKCNT